MAKGITTSSQWTDIPPYLQDYFMGGFGGLTEAGKQFPSISELPGAVPLLEVPGMTPEQTALMNQIIQSGTTSPDLAAARTQLQQLTSGPIGSSPATAAGMKAFQDLIAPSILQGAALQGNAAGGAALGALQQGATQAALPLIQQEIATRQAAVGQYGTLQQQQMQQLAAAFEASGMPRDVALQQAKAAYDKATKGFGIESAVQLTPLDLISQFLGRSNRGQQYQTKTAEDWINQGIGAAGGALSAFGI